MYELWLGVMCRVRISSSFVNCLEMGIYGISVKMQSSTAGIAMAKSKEIDFALALSPDFFNCAAKNIKASYNGTPLKPGRIICLLLSAIKVTGVEFNIIRSIFITAHFYRHFVYAG